jgi:putative addiction module CopG family antidote
VARHALGLKRSEAQLSAALRRGRGRNLGEEKSAAQARYRKNFVYHPDIIGHSNYELDYDGSRKRMTIRLKPETEALIERDVQRGPYRSADDLVEEAIHQLHDREEWLAQNRAEIERAIEEGYVSAQRGDLLSEDELRAHLKQRQQAWRNRPGPA